MHDAPPKVCNTIDIDRRPNTVSQRIRNQIVDLEKRLDELRAAEQALKSNPAIAGVIDTLSRLGL